MSGDGGHGLPRAVSALSVPEQGTTQRSKHRSESAAISGHAGSVARVPLAGNPCTAARPVPGRCGEGRVRCVGCCPWGAGCSTRVSIPPPPWERLRFDWELSGSRRASRQGRAAQVHHRMLSAGSQLPCR